jgi:hypothetical protein
VIRREEDFEVVWHTVWREAPLQQVGLDEVGLHRIGADIVVIEWQNVLRGDEICRGAGISGVTGGQSRYKDKNDDDPNPLGHGSPPCAVSVQQNLMNPCCTIDWWFYLLNEDILYCVTITRMDFSHSNAVMDEVRALCDCLHKKDTPIQYAK